MMTADETRFSITINKADGDAPQPGADYVVIDADTGRYSDGCIVLDRPADLHKLRAAIDEFIIRNGIKPPQ